MTTRQTTDGTPREYLTGFGNEHSTEALAGALPIGRNSPQRPPYGLFAEKFSGTAFTAPRGSNSRTWFYRIRPSVVQGAFVPYSQPLLRSAPFPPVDVLPNALRWDPFAIPAEPRDFVDGLIAIVASGNVRAQAGLTASVYVANRSMEGRFFGNADGELLVVPQQGRIRCHSECGILDVAPGQMLLIPRGMKFRMVLPDGAARGYVCENYGALFRLPELGPIGSDGLANSRDFEAPVAAYEDREGDFELLWKLDGQVYTAPMGHSPLDVVAWHGNLTPVRYDLRRFNTMGTVSYDHPDPSIYTVLTAPTDRPGTANVDFVVFPPRWLVAEDTFRPPWYHRNVMSEYMGLVHGVYDAKPDGGFKPGGGSLHTSMVPHGPDAAAFGRASTSELMPQALTDTLAFMFETRYLLLPSARALSGPELQRDYRNSWQQLRRGFDPLQR